VSKIDELRSDLGMVFDRKAERDLNETLRRVLTMDGRLNTRVSNATIRRLIEQLTRFCDARQPHPESLLKLLPAIEQEGIPDAAYGSGRATYDKPAFLGCQVRSLHDTEPPPGYYYSAKMVVTYPEAKKLERWTLWHLNQRGRFADAGSPFESKAALDAWVSQRTGNFVKGAAGKKMMLEFGQEQPQEKPQVAPRPVPGA
jgi:hypothetical protein